MRRNTELFRNLEAHTGVALCADFIKSAWAPLYRKYTILLRSVQSERAGNLKSQALYLGGQLVTSGFTDSHQRCISVIAEAAQTS